MHIIRKAVLVSLLSVLGYVVWIIVSGYEEIASSFSLVGVSGILVLALLSLANYLLRFIRWHWMLGKVTQKKVPLIHHLQFYVAGFALTATPGKVGEALRSVYLRPYGIRVSDSLAALFAERLFDVMAILIISALAFIKFDSYQWVGFVVLAIVIGASVLIRTRLLIVMLNYVRPTIKHKKLQDGCSHLISLIDSTAHFMTWKMWGTGLATGIVAWGAEAWGFALLIQWLSGENQFLLTSSIYAVSMLVGAVSFLPGGIGGAEVTMASLLLVIGLSFADVTVATIVCRIMTLWFAVVLGLLVMLKFHFAGVPKISTEDQLT